MIDKHIFIDTGAYLALFHKRDQQHKKSCEVWDCIKNSGCISITTNHIIDELATLLARRTSYDFASRKLHEIYGSEHPIITRPDQKDELEALEVFSKYADQKVSFTDCISFHGEVDIIYGPKGSGKSALYSLLIQRTYLLFDLVNFRKRR